MLDKQQRVVPKGEARKRLEKEDRVQVVKFYREMDINELKQIIQNAFKRVRSYTVLACSGHTSIVSSNESLVEMLLLKGEALSTLLLKNVMIMW